jgi:hypothetical protein
MGCLIRNSDNFLLIPKKEKKILRRRLLTVNLNFFSQHVATGKGLYTAKDENL